MKNEPNQEDQEARARRAAEYESRNSKPLERDRAELVRRYRQYPQAWTDGIDHAGNPLVSLTGQNERGLERVRRYPGKQSTVIDQV